MSFYNIILAILSTGFLLASLGMFIGKFSWFNLNNFFYPEERQVLASLKTDLNLEGSQYKVLKIKSGKKIWIEIYNLNTPEKHAIAFGVDAKANGQMMVDKKASALFASDLDGDNIMEIVSPTFNKDFQPQINAYKLDTDSGDFLQMSRESLIEML